jgi:hypothetical protein
MHHDNVDPFMHVKSPCYPGEYHDERQEEIAKGRTMSLSDVTTYVQ